jgi:hypothetical protein
MDPRIDALSTVLAPHRSALAAAIWAVPDAIRRSAPTPGRWSVGNVLEHLLQTERSVAQLLERFVAGAAPRAADEPFDAAAFAAHVALPWALDRTRRVRGAQPSGEMTWHHAWAELQSSRELLLDVGRRGAGLRLEKLSHRHPAGPELDGYQWIAFVGLHEARHAEQIREIGARLA